MEFDAGRVSQSRVGEELKRRSRGYRKLGRPNSFRLMSRFFKARVSGHLLVSDVTYSRTEVKGRDKRWDSNHNQTWRASADTAWCSRTSSSRDSVER